MTRVVVAVPTIPERRHLHAEVEAAWHRHTCQPVQVIFSEAPGSWSAGLNDIWQQTLEVEEPPDVFCCSSDDMIPEDDNWLPPLMHHLAQRQNPAPCVIDPRWTNYGGHDHPVADGTPSEMSSFPVLRGDWLETVFPLPADLSYFCDNWISVLLSRDAVPCVAVPSSRIRHLWAQEGRGFGEGSEWAAMLTHSARYTRALADRGIDRASLPVGQKGPCA